MYRVVESLLTLGNIGNYDIFAVFFRGCELNDNDDVRNNSSKDLQIQSIFVLVACYEMLVNFEVICIIENAERTSSLQMSAPQSGGSPQVNKFE